MQNEIFKTKIEYDKDRSILKSILYFTDNTNDTEKLRDAKLLQYYLVKDLLQHNYTLKKAQETVKEILCSTDNLFGYHGLAWELGKKNLEFFCLYYLSNIYLGDNKAMLSLTHFSIWEELQDMILIKNYNQRNYICPRGFGKTTCISTPLAIWSHCYKFKKYTVLSSATGDTAEEFLKNIKNAIIDNDKIKNSFGELIDPKRFTCNSEKIEFTNKTMIQSISASGAIRGKNYNTTRIELLILDDYQKADEVATDEARIKKWKIFNEDAKNAMQKNNSTMLGVGTVQHKECFYSRLINSPTWKSRIEKGVLIEDVDNYFHSGLWEMFYKILMDLKDDNRLDTAKEFYFQHEKDMQFPTLWNDYWNCLDLALSFYEDKVAFMQEIQNDVNSIGEKKFKSIATETPEEIENHTFLKTLLCIDPANTRTKSSKKDYFAFVVTSTCENKFKYIRKGEIHKFTRNLEYEEYIQHTLQLLKDYKDITHLAIEKNTYGGADVLKLQELIQSDKELKCRNIEIINYYQTTNKEDKIKTIIPCINLGQVIFNNEDNEAIEQLKEYAGTKFTTHDDFPDIVAQAYKLIDEIEVTENITLLDRKLFF